MFASYEEDKTTSMPIEKIREFVTYSAYMQTSKKYRTLRGRFELPQRASTTGFQDRRRSPLGYLSMLDCGWFLNSGFRYKAFDTKTMWAILNKE